jgi:hypothetical protein
MGISLLSVQLAVKNRESEMALRINVVDCQLLYS